MADTNNEWDKINASVQSLASANNKAITDYYSTGTKTPNRKALDETKKKRNEYELIDGSYITAAEAKIRKKSKKSKGGKNIKITDFPISGGATKSPEASKSLLEDLIISKKKKKNSCKKASKRRVAAAAKTTNNFDLGYSELEAILRADDSIINDPDKGILEWANSVLNPDEIYNFAEELSSNTEDEDEDDVIEISDDDDDEVQYIPTKSVAAQHRVGVCPKCSATRKLVNFVWECECSKNKKKSSKWDISDSFYGIVSGNSGSARNDQIHKDSSGYGLFRPQSCNDGWPLPSKSGLGRKSYASAARSKIYEKKKPYQSPRGKEVSLLAHRFKAVSLNPSAPDVPSSSQASKKPILRSLLQDDPTWALPNSINFDPSTAFYEPESIFGSNDYYSQLRGLGTSKPRYRPTPAVSNDCPLLRGILEDDNPSKAAITRKRTSRFTQTATTVTSIPPTSTSSSSSSFSTLKAELEQEKLHRMAVEAKVAALEMKFSQCLSLIEDSLPSLTTRLNNISLTCDHINKICETTKAEKQSAMDELNAAKERIIKLEKEHAKYRDQSSSNKVSKKPAVSQKEVIVIDEMKELMDELNGNDNDDDDNDSEYSFVY